MPAVMPAVMPAAPKSRAGAVAAARGPSAQTVRDTATDRLSNSERTRAEEVTYLHSAAEYRALPGCLQFTLMAALKSSWLLNCGWGCCAPHGRW